MSARRGSTLLALGFAVAAAVMVLPGARAADDAPKTALAELNDGCDSDRPAVAFHGDGRPADTTEIVVPCADRTGHGGQETHIRVAPDNTVVEIPAWQSTGLPAYMTAGLAVLGEGIPADGPWDLVYPDGRVFQPQDNAIHIDRETGHLFVALISEVGEWLAGETMLLSSPPSPDGWVDWTSTIMHGHVGTENPRFTSAPAPEGVEAVEGRMTYWCGNHGILVGIVARSCYRSFDLGASWEQASIAFTRPVPQHPECGTSEEQFSPLDGNYPQGAPDGSLWITVRCGGQTYLARSTDLGSSFPIQRGPGDAPLTVPGPGFRELRVDSAGNLYAFERHDGALGLWISRDEGLTWSAPIDLTAPAARGASIYQWQAAVGGPGQIGVTYLVDRGDGTYDGYVTASRDALADDPVLFAATINEPQRPMVSMTGPGADFIDLDIGPDGTPWAAYYADCPTGQPDAFCDAARPLLGQDGNSVTGPLATTVGRLVWTAT